MSSQPIDEDGFHSIAWDDAPPRTNSRPILTEISGSDDGEGFETISPGSPVASASGSAARDQDTLTERQYRDRGEHDTDKQQSVDFNGKWMSIEVRDPVKEHEGSKDMYVSYAVRTKVCPFYKTRKQKMTERQTCQIIQMECWLFADDSKTLRL
jgi:sorting nexin-4